MPYPIQDIQHLIKSKIHHIEGQVYKIVEELTAEAWITKEPVIFSERMSGEKKSVSIHQKWGELWDCAWFHFTGEVPTSASGKKTVLLLDISGEGCIYDANGCPIQGLTNVSSNFDYSLGRPGKRVVELSENASGGEIIDLWVDAGCNDLFGGYKDNGSLKEAYIAICNEEIKELYYDYVLLNELMEILPQDSARSVSIMYALKETALILQEINEEEVRRAKAILEKELCKKGGDPSLKVSAIGHAHIDLAWLWPIRETKRKGARTFSTALKMMKKYPDYVFGASQPQLYEWIKEDHPELYKKIAKRIEEGRWEPQGGMWVEADTNISGGEALIRQFLYGKRFFQNEFHQDMKVLWLPDVFGYTGALPQIMKKCGCDYFMTIKLSWSSYNKFPHHTFVWEGIDGTKVLVHMPPEGTYNSSGAPRAVLKAEKEYIDKGVSEECLMLFGIGDGGGGPGEEHLEMLKREKDLHGLAPVTQEPSVNFFKRLECGMEKYEKWTGELYLEKHQGTYTTQAMNKYFNRKMELALREAEIVSSIAAILLDCEYPKDEFDRTWKETMLYQFHDILPGSSIQRVYKESIERYSEMHKRIQSIIEDTYTKLMHAIDTSDYEYPIVLFNSLSWNREEWVNTGRGWIHTSVPPMGYRVIDASQANECACYDPLKCEKDFLENDKLRIQLDHNGQICSVFDKENHREVIPQGSVANTLSVYCDDGDAWDFSILYNQKPVSEFVLVSSEAKVEGPNAILTQVYTYGGSTLVQEIVLSYGSRRIDFNTKVDWQERNKMLKTSFPVNVFSSDAVCDIQFGNIKRPTHSNTSWDMAKFEICAHKWMDISQPDYGVALLNNCKYGHRVIGNVLELNLLRGTNYPGVDADKGSHEFTYSLYPHQGDHIAGQVNRQGYELNIPLAVCKTERKTAALAPVAWLIDIDKENIIIEAVKKAEDSDDIIIRLYECNGMNSEANIKFNRDIVWAKLTDMMEHEIKDLQPEEKNTLKLVFKPFEIHTLKVKIK